MRLDRRIRVSAAYSAPFSRFRVCGRNRGVSGIEGG